jgi:membrane protein required for colicin V production
LSIDIIIAILCVLAFIRGYKKGLLWAIASLAAVVLGSLVSLKLSHRFAAFISEQGFLDSKYTLIIAYIILFIAVMYGLRLLIKFVEKILETFFLGWANRLAGGLLYVVFTLFVASSILWLANQVQLIKEQTKHESNLYTLIEPIAPMGIKIGGEALPFLKDLYGDVALYLEKVSKKPL